MSKKSGKTLKLILVGATGRMGREIEALAGESGFAIQTRITTANRWKSAAANADVVIDFSTPEGLEQALEWAMKNSKPLVSGTTGLHAKTKDKLNKASAKIPVLYSANMSLGLAALCQMINALAPLKAWDFQIEEAHHARKKDKPSGTALLLQKKLADVIQKPLPEPLSIRGGGLTGIHKIWAMSEDESLVLQHTAFHRRVFARGALYGAQWLIDKKQPGLYDLTDLYKLT